MSKICYIFVLLAWALLNQQACASKNDHIETAARLNVAENICDINFGDSIVKNVMLGAAELSVSIETAAKMADIRHVEILKFLNKSGKLDQFCRNARNGKIW